MPEAAVFYGGFPVRVNVVEADDGLLIVNVDPETNVQAIVNGAVPPVTEDEPVAKTTFDPGHESPLASAAETTMGV